MSRSLVELRPNKLLLDPSFGGYKLSLEPIPIYRKQIESGVRVVHPGDDQFSFHHVKLFSLHNHLYVNPYRENSVYFIDKRLKVLKVILSLSNQVVNLKEVHQIESSPLQLTGSYNASVVFASPEIVLISSGHGVVTLARVSGCDDTEKWESQSLYTEEGGCVIADARIVLTDKKRALHVLVLFVEEKIGDKEENVKSGLFHMKLKWRTFIEGTNTWEQKSHRALRVDGNMDSVALEPSGKSVYLVSDKLPTWVYDSVNPVQATELEPPLPPPKTYSWTQTEEEITIWVALPGTEKADVDVCVTDLQMDIKVKGNSLVSGQFFHRVSKDLTTWCFEKNKLEIQLTKHESGLMWKSLLQDDNAGEEILDAEVVKNIHERLAHLCSDKEEAGAPASFVNQQLEDCDVVSCDKSLVRVNGETHATTHEVNLSASQWLFNVPCDPRQAPAMCFRHDVDACVWQFTEAGKEEKTWPHHHVGTFSAFGYVQASKTQKKFLASPPNLSYAAVCEASHRVYIYRQPSPLSSELKNRHTGKKVETIAKQQLVNLEANEQILGVHASNHLLVVLLESSLRVLVVNT